MFPRVQLGYTLSIWAYPLPARHIRVNIELWYFIWTWAGHISQCLVGRLTRSRTICAERRPPKVPGGGFGGFVELPGAPGGVGYLLYLRS